MKAKKCLSKSKRVIISAVAALCALSSVAAITAGAVEKVQTDDVYMMGYRLYGSVTAYPTSAQGFTYCERTSAGKSARTQFRYQATNGTIITKFNGSNDHTYNNDTSLSVTSQAVDSSKIKYYLGAMTVSKVYYKDQPQYNWTSEGTDNELRLGCYKR